MGSGVWMERLGRRNTIWLGAGCQVAAILWCATLNFSANPTAFALQLALVRALQGSGEGFVNVGVLSIMRIYLDDSDYSFYTYVNNIIVGISVGLGSLIGQWLGSFFDGQYFWPLIIVGFVHTSSVFLGVYYIPNDLDKFEIQSVPSSQNSHTDQENMLEQDFTKEQTDGIAIQ